MAGDVGSGMEDQTLMDVKGRNGTSTDQDEAKIPSCCVKARSLDPEFEANCHSTVVSGWFSEPQSSAGHYLFLLILMQDSFLDPFF